ncbi:MAG: hypothetical protein R6V45_09270 [Oceanipulchritudo sp.]
MNRMHYRASAFLVSLIAAVGVQGAFWENAPAEDGWYDVEGTGWVIGERLNANDLPGVLDYASLRRDEQREFRMIAEALKQNYQLKVFHNGTALARVEMVYDESMSGPLAGGGSLNLVIDGWPVPFLSLWFS